jgi:hypothetical protein
MAQCSLVHLPANRGTVYNPETREAELSVF